MILTQFHHHHRRHHLLEVKGIVIIRKSLFATFLYLTTFKVWFEVYS